MTSGESRSVLTDMLRYILAGILKDGASSCEQMQRYDNVVLPVDLFANYMVVMAYLEVT